MKTLTGWFTFYFHYEPLDDEEVEASNSVENDGSFFSFYRFTISGSEDQFLAFYKKHFDSFEMKSGEMEKHGIHDAYAGLGTLEGFDSYEIHPDTQVQVMEEWREWFEGIGFHVGDIEQVTLEESGDEPDLTPEEQKMADLFDQDIEAIRNRAFAH